ALPENIDIALTNEWFSTMEGRKLYFKENPPRGWRRLIPTSLQTPPRSIDDYAAVVILKRHFKENG
ncbi:MAG: resolvase, partial [Abditibacteriota bacterium]|nr:resolvase [Abditibacteriota bacterium]